MSRHGTRRAEMVELVSARPGQVTMEIARHLDCTGRRVHQIGREAGLLRKGWTATWYPSGYVPEVNEAGRDALDSLAREPMTRAQLVDDTGRSESSILRVVTQLLADGLVERSERAGCKAYGRAAWVYSITPAGRAVPR